MAEYCNSVLEGLKNWSSYMAGPDIATAKEVLNQVIRALRTLS
jgi:hypothetical protein